MDICENSESTCSDQSDDIQIIDDEDDDDFLLQEVNVTKTIKDLSEWI